MIRIAIEIEADPDGKHCGECSHRVGYIDKAACNQFRNSSNWHKPTRLKVGVLDAERCQACLDAELTTD